MRLIYSGVSVEVEPLLNFSNIRVQVRSVMDGIEVCLLYERMNAAG